MKANLVLRNASVYTVDKHDVLKELIERYVDAGAEKFVARPACPPEMMREQLEILGTEIVPHYQV